MPAAVRCQIPALASPDPGVGPKRSPTPPYLSGLTWLLHPLEFGPPHSTKVPRDSSHSLSSQGTELGLSRSDSALAAPAPPLDPPLPLRCRLGLGVQTHLQTPLLSPAQRGQRGRRGCQGLKKRRVPEEEGLHRGLRKTVPLNFFQALEMEAFQPRSHSFNPSLPGGFSGPLGPRHPKVKP
ncbi:uncharacterized protein LOC123334135 isoform X2 [Bubalus bubalis]|nr:uncharacterized protein LOC123334135 isoform X2 [Bubalus bubalis]